MGLRDLSVAIILQAASDLLDTPRDKNSLEFFSGEGFRLCAELAKMEHNEKIKFLTMLTECISERRKNGNYSDKKQDLTDRRPSKRVTLSHRCRKRAVMNVA